MRLKEFVLKCYQDWIDTEVPLGETLCECTLWSRVMKKQFPELIHVGGYVRKSEGVELFFSSLFNNSYHEYLITEDGDIVDPTAVQFDKVIGKGKWHYDRCEEHLIQ